MQYVSFTLNFKIIKVFVLPGWPFKNKSLGFPIFKYKNLGEKNPKMLKKIQIAFEVWKRKFSFYFMGTVFTKLILV